MRFRSDSELGFFLYRNLASSYVYKRLVPGADLEFTQSLEQIGSETTDWRIVESSLDSLLSSIDIEQGRTIISKGDFKIRVSTPRERQFIDEILALSVEFDEEPQVEEALKHPVSLIISTLALCIYGCDLLSASFIFSNLCPEVLPAMRRLSCASGLNMMQALTSFVQKAGMCQTSDSDPVLSRHLDFLKSFNATLEKIQDVFDESKDPCSALEAAADVASNFLLSTDDAGSNAKVRSAVKWLRAEIRTVWRNFEMFARVIPKDYQKAPHFVTNTERVCQLLVDRMNITVPITAVMKSAPIFSSPIVTAVANSPGSPHPAKVQTVVAAATPIAAQPALESFLNNQTPTPVRPIACTTLAELIEEEKENIDPNCVKNGVEKDDKTPKRSKLPGLRLRQQEKTSAAGPKAKRPSSGPVSGAKRAPKPTRTLFAYFK